MYFSSSIANFKKKILKKLKYLLNVFILINKAIEVSEEK